MLRLYQDFVAGEEDMQHIDERTSLMYVKRFVHVASYLPMEPPSESSESLRGKNEAMMLLLFAKDGTYEWS
jgi:hypothetical protein